MKNKSKEVLEKFLLDWSELNYDKMYQNCTKTWCLNNSKKNLKSLLHTRIKKYKILEVMHLSDVMYDVNVKVRIKGDEKIIKARLLCEEAPFKPSLDGDLGVNPVSLLRGLY